MVEGSLPVSLQTVLHVDNNVVTPVSLEGRTRELAVDEHHLWEDTTICGLIVIPLGDFPVESPGTRARRWRGRLIVRLDVEVVSPTGSVVSSIASASSSRLDLGNLESGSGSRRTEAEEEREGDKARKG